MVRRQVSYRIRNEKLIHTDTSIPMDVAPVKFLAISYWHFLNHPRFTQVLPMIIIIRNMCTSFLWCEIVPSKNVCMNNLSRIYVCINVSFAFINFFNTWTLSPLWPRVFLIWAKLAEHHSKRPSSALLW